MAVHRGWHERGYLPHCDGGAITQAITYRLADSLPSNVEGKTPEQRRRCEALLDNGCGCCLLRDSAAAGEVISAWRHFDGVRYRLHAWLVMPNHVHLVVTLREEHPLSGIIHSWNSFTARRINLLTGRSGRLWSPDYYDRFIRDDAHFLAAVDYVEQNPVKAGLVTTPTAWPFSSAYDSHNSSSPKAMR